MAANTLTAVMYAILTRSLPVLRESCWGPQTVLSDFKAEVAKQGQTINATVYPESTPYDIVPSHLPKEPKGSVPTNVSVTMSNHKGDNFHATDKEMREIANEADFLPRSIETKIRGLANAVNASVLAEYVNFYGYVGTAGTTPFSNATDRTAAKDATLAVAKLNAQLCPRGNRFGLLDEMATAEATALPQFAHAEKRGNNRVLEDASVGNQYGVNWLQESAVPTHTAGTITTGLIAKAATAQAVGDKTIVCTTAATSGAVDFKKGDIITFAGHTQTYVVTADTAEASAATDVTIPIEPGLKTALTGSEAVAVKGDRTVNMVYHRDAIVLASRLLDRDTGNPTAVITDPVTQLTIRLEKMRQYKQTMWELDILWGVATWQRSFGLQLAG